MSDQIERGATLIEAFSDGFFAIVITLLVLDLKPPQLLQDTADYVSPRMDL